MSTPSSKVHPSDEVPPTARDDGRRGKTEPTTEGLERQKCAEMPEQGPVPEVKSGKGLRSLCLELKLELRNQLQDIMGRYGISTHIGGDSHYTQLIGPFVCIFGCIRVLSAVGIQNTINTMSTLLGWVHPIVP